MQTPPPRSLPFAGITDVQISLASLEEVFLGIARAAELEAAAAEGRGEVEVELEGGAGRLRVPLGEQYATDPGTGRHYQLKWVQDDEGNLQVGALLRIFVFPPRGGWEEAAAHMGAGRQGRPAGVFGGVGAGAGVGLHFGRLAGSVGGAAPF